MSYHVPYYNHASPTDAPPPYSPLGYPPQGYTAQPCVTPGCGTGMQPVQTGPVQMYPHPPRPFPEQWTRPAEHMSLPRHTSRTDRYESEAFEADNYPFQSRRNDHSQTVEKDAYYSNHSTALFTDPEKAIETLKDHRKESKRSTRPRQVYTEDESQQSRFQNFRRHQGA